MVRIYFYAYVCVSECRCEMLFECVCVRECVSECVFCYECLLIALF